MSLVGAFAGVAGGIYYGIKNSPGLTSLGGSNQPKVSTVLGVGAVVGAIVLGGAS